MLKIGGKAVDTLYVGSKLVKQVYVGSKKVYPDEGVIPKQIRDAMVLWYDIKKQAATNESMAENPVLVDHSGNGHDATCYNFAWSGMSGIGGYAYDFTTFNQSTLSDCTQTKFTITKEGSGYGGTYKQNDWSNQKFTLRITNFNSSDATLIVRYYYNDEEGVLQMSGAIVTISDNGDYEVNSPQYTNATGIVIQWTGAGSCTVEQLPIYPNALVSDGVDDYAMVKELPLLTKERGYTVICKRKILYDNPVSVGLATKREENNYNAFVFEKEGSSIGQVAWNFSIIGYAINFVDSDITWQTSKLYNNQKIGIGGQQDSKYLALFGANINTSTQKVSELGTYAIYSFLLFDRDLTPDEIDWVKTNLMD